MEVQLPEKVQIIGLKDVVKIDTPRKTEYIGNMIIMV